MKSLNLKSEKCVRGKHSKIRLTGMAAANPLREKLLMFVIGTEVGQTPGIFHADMRAQKKLDG